MTFVFNGNTIIAILALLAGLIGYVKLYYDQRHLYDSRLTQIEVKVDTMWRFQMRRAFSETLERGIATMNSPLKFIPEAIKRLDPIRSELVGFYQNYLMKNHINSDAAILWHLEEKFGKRLLEYACVPCALSHGSCLLLALAVARETDSIDLNV